MLKKVLLCLLLLSCEGGQGPILAEKEELSEVWICHSPSSPEHGNLCSEQCFIYSQDNPHCWRL